MFSYRTPAPAPPNALTQAQQALQTRGIAYLDLSVSNPTRVGLLASPALLEPLSDARGLSYAAHAQGLLGAREAVCDYYETRGSRRPDPRQLFLTASTSEAYAYLFKLLADPGARVLVPRPSYPLFEHLLALEGLEPIFYPCAYDGEWHIDQGALPELMAQGAAALVVVNPNNPTGAYLKRHERALLHALSVRYEVPLISDEVFGDFAFFPDADRVEVLAEEAPVLSFSLGGLSKCVGLPQLKLGWIYANGPADQLEQALSRLELIADTYLSVSTPVQLALPSLLGQWQQLQAPLRARVMHNRARALEQIKDCPALSPLRSEGGWYLLLRVPRIKSEEHLVLELLERDRVLVHPGYFFDLEQEGVLVISLLPEPEVLEQGLNRVIARLMSL